MKPDDQKSGTLWQLVCHYIDAMSWRMLLAGGLIAFFFFYGAANALIKFTGREISSFNFPPGPVFGLFCTSFLIIAVVIIKLRSPD